MGDKKPICKDPFGNEIFMSETTMVDQKAKNVHKLLTIIGDVCFSGIENWAEACFVSDGSRLSDFGTDDGDLEKIGKRLGFAVSGDDYIYECATRMEVPN